MNFRELTILSGNASLELTKGVCENLGVEQGKTLVDSFSNGEIRVQIGDNIRGNDVFIVNSTSAPVNHHLMELLVLTDAAKRASADRITAVLPYFGYARQDRKDRPRVPITAKLVANLVTAAGANRVLTVDLHCGQIQGFFDIPVDHLSGEVVFFNYIREQGMEDMVIVSPDTGSVGRSREIANRLETPLAIVDKRRPRQNEAEVMNIIGDVEGMHAVIFDDMVDTAGTLVKAAEAIKRKGALDVIACCTHPLLSGGAVDLINDSVLGEILVGDTVALSDKAAKCEKIKVLSFAPMIGEAIRRIHKDESVSSLFR